MKEITRIIHEGVKKTFVPKIIKASTIIFKKLKNILIYKIKNKQIYGTGKSEIECSLENKIKTIEKAKYCILTNTGLLAITITLASLLQKNETIVLLKNIYEPTKNFVKILKKMLNIKVYYINFKNFLHKIKKINKKNNIKIIFLENPSSITFKCINLKSIAKYTAKQNIITIIDNTYYSSIIEKPIKQNVSISIQALTKFISGNNDVLMGSISTNNYNLFKKIKKFKKAMGLTINQEDCHLIIRNIYLYKMRYKKQSKNTEQIIKWLRSIKYIQYIFKCKNKKVKQYSGSVFSFSFKKNIKIKMIANFVEKLNIFKLGYSWGGSISLIMIYKNNIKNSKIKYIIRLSIGLENIKDIKKDILNSLKEFK